MCRRWAGSAVFCAATERVTFEGKDFVGRFDSSEWAQRGFCTRCGTHLFYFLKPTGMHLMSVGTFDDQGAFRLVREIFIDRKPAGFAFAGDHERWTEKETFERLTPA
jgi:hypothetical protein